MFNQKLSLKPIQHNIRIFEGKDANSYIVNCSCGWGYSNTKLACQQKADLHCHIATAQRWNDPKRAYEMPTYIEIKQRLP